jgi:hypothetical protein
MQQNPMPSPIATPTREDTATHLDKGTDQEREKLFATNVCLLEHFLFEHNDVDSQNTPGDIA